MTKEKIKFLVSLNHFSKFGPVKLRKLNNYFSNYENAFRAGISELKQAGIDENTAQEFLSARDKLDPDMLMQKLEKENIKTITIDNKCYPKLLSEIYDPPPLLYYRGSLAKNDEYCFAVVGTRKYTNYGQQVTEKIVADLAKNQVTVVSGLAYGIDSIAHNACVDTKARTIAVLGTGLDIKSIYPSSNRYLVEKIIEEGGMVISEFPLRTAPLRHNFPLRNRIISGLSLGTLVVEAGERSGALITAKSALEQNREVFAVPGSIFSPVSIGPNNLIKQGARAISNAEEILETLDLIHITSYIDNKKIIPDSPEEKLIIEHLSLEPTHIDELIRNTKMNTALMNSTLTIMEMKGMIKNLGNMQYILAR